MVSVLNAAASIAALTINYLTYPPLCFLSYTGTVLWERIYTSFLSLQIAGKQN